jgi:TonB-linked SusC/RagA family outer membrane protein
MNLNTLLRGKRSIISLKMVFLSIFFLTTQVGIAQNQKIVLSGTNLTLRSAFDQIEKQTQMTIDYEQFSLDHNKKISNTIKSGTLNEVLTQLLKETNCNFTIKDLHILITPKPQNAKVNKITGIVTDQNREPIIGASVMVKGTKIKTITNYDGNFSLEAPEQSIVTVSYIGYSPMDQAVGSRKTLVFKLQEDLKALDEVVVIGYGTQKKVNLTGAVSCVSASALESRPVTNVTTALQGLMPGATIIQNSGQPGKDMGSIRIRGIGTLNNSNPMYVVDGIVVSNMNDIDPNDIESISILKDAASAAIYGSRASNGVVLITSKKGANKAATLKYDGYVGVQQPTGLLDYLPSWEYAQLYNKAINNQDPKHLATRYTPEEIQKFKDGSDPDNYPNTDWLGMLYKKNGGFQQSHRAELSGGSENTTYMFSVGYFDQKGIIDKANFKRYNARTNISTKIDKITASLNLAFTYGNTTEPTNPYTGDMYQIFRQINRIAPFVPYKYSNGYYGYLTDGNPLAWMDLDATRSEQYRKTRGVGNVTYEPIKGLKIQEVLGYEYTGSSDEKFIKDIQFYNWKTGAPTIYQGPNSQTDKRADDQMVTLQTLITYDKTFGKHNISALAGYSQESNRGDWNSSYRKGFLNNNLHEINAGSTDGQKAEGSAYEYSLQSFFGRISYNFDSKYLLEANIRRDGTSRMSKSNQWGTFPSFSAAWRIINEPFMANTRDVLSDLKIRAGWGILGNQNLNTPDPVDNPYGGYYPYQSVLSPANYDFGGKVNQGVALVNGVNQNIKWESSETTNIGVDLGLFSNRLTLTTDLYRRKTYDVLLLLPVPTPLGLTSPFQNAGEVLNQGIEFQLGYKFKVEDCKFDILANASYNNNKVTNLHNDGARIWDGFRFRQEGSSIDTYGGYEALGLFRTQDDLNNSAVINRGRAGLGDIKYKDQLTIDTNGDGIPDKADGVINAADRVALGNSAPAWIFGTTLSAAWKGFDIQMLFQGAADVKGYVQLEMVGQLLGNTSKPTSVFRDSYDAVTNPNGNFPRPLSTWTDNDSGKNPSSFWIVDASYVRLKNVQFGYTIPTNVCKLVGMSKVRIYYSGQNLLTFTGLRKGFDPEAPAGARAYYPQVKTNTIGLSVSF